MKDKTTVILIASSSNNINYNICNSIKFLSIWSTEEERYNKTAYDDGHSDSASLHFWPRFESFWGEKIRWSWLSQDPGLKNEAIKHPLWLLISGIDILELH